MTENFRETKTVTVKDIIKAAGANGFKWIPGDWLEVSGLEPEDEKPRITGACILGQAMLNLEVKRQSLYYALSRLAASDMYYGNAAEEIIDYNDSLAKNFNEAFMRLEKVLEPYKDEVFELEVGDWTKLYDVEGSRSTPRDTAGQEAVQT